MSRIPGFTAGAALARSFPATWQEPADPHQIHPQGCDRCFYVDSGDVPGRDPNVTLMAAHQAAFAMIPIKARALGVRNPSAHCLAEHLGSSCRPDGRGGFICQSRGRACYAS